MGAGWSRLETQTIKPFIAKQGHWVSFSFRYGLGSVQNDIKNHLLAKNNISIYFNKLI